jgi:hypothetical protein
MCETRNEFVFVLLSSTYTLFELYATAATPVVDWG